MQFKKDLSQFHQKVRVRVCGILNRNQSILLLKHNGIGSGGFLWSPPGGGLEFGEDARSCLEREFKEETGLLVKVGQFLFTNEYMDKHHHAIELFFEVFNSEDVPILGRDPELSDENQVLLELAFFNEKDLKETLPQNKHNIFHDCHQISELLKLKGFYFFNNI